MSKAKCVHVIAAFWCFSNQVVESQTPDPNALLRGAEEARRSIRSGLLRFKINESMHGRKPLTTHVELAFNAERRTAHYECDALVVAGEGGPKALAAVDFDNEKAQAQGIGKIEHLKTSWAFDGSKFCYYRAGDRNNASYRDINEDGDYTFDPRLLGILNLYSDRRDLSLLFSNPDAKNHQVVGKEMIGNMPVWHVRYEDPRARIHYWIEDREPFRVHKRAGQVLTRHEGYDVTVESEFLDVAGPLPKRVHVTMVGSTGGIVLESVLEVQEIRLNEEMDQKVGTLASLNMPIGTVVVDAFKHKGLGGWDGAEVNPAKLPTFKKGESATTRPVIMWITLAIFVVFVGLTAIRRWYKKALLKP